MNKKLFEQIPGVYKSGWQYEDYEKFVKNENNNVTFLNQCKNIISKIRQNKNAWPFLKPVDLKEVPDYLEIIKEPMGKKFYLFFFKRRTNIRKQSRNWIV